ncbi:MAG: class I SAM-dependent methyltransferase [Pseudomonadota bacterium]
MAAERPPAHAPMACAVCGGFEAKLRYPVRDLIQARPGRWWFVTCAACGHGYLSPHPTPEELGELYRDLWSPEGLQLAQNVGRSGFERGLIKHRLAALMAALGAHPVARLLDVGCGLGFFLNAMHQAWPAAESLGVELVEAAASRAERPDVSVLRRPFEEVELPEGSFDVVTLIHFLEHQTDPGADVVRAAKLLRPGGVLAVEVPQRLGWGRRLLGRWYWPHLPPQHLQIFSRAGLCRLLAERGLTVAVTRARSGYPLQVTTALVLMARYTFGSESALRDRWLIRGPLMALGIALLPFTLLWDAILSPLLNLCGLGDILLVVARK